MSNTIQRRSFLKKAALATGASITLPYILPSGRLFAASGQRIANHVVLCLFAGGVRNVEAIGQDCGNLLPGLMGGALGVDPAIASGIELLPALPENSVLSHATLFKNFRYKQGYLGHFNGHLAALTGHYSPESVNSTQKPLQPTLFELYRKHSGSARKNAWWVSNSLGVYPALGCSSNTAYGVDYQAEFTRPSGNETDNWGLGTAMNSDIQTVLKARSVIEEYQPELLVLNLQGADICHSNFTQYCNNLHKADFAISKLWESIQNTPGMANNTIMIVAPEHGRDLRKNEIADQFGQLGIDHSGDKTSREIFCMIAGSPNKVIQNQIISATSGESIDILPTIAHILGFADDISAGMLPGRVLEEAFV